MTITTRNLDVFKSLFRGRTDVYARYWERDGQKGYMPAYNLDWDEYKNHKAAGGTFKTFGNKQLAPLTDHVIRQHLSGKDFIGIYPLLKDNTSWFITADFDEKNWLDDCRKLVNVCQAHTLPAIIEQSRSGNGGHVWLFFDQPVPASKSRKILLRLLRLTGLLSDFAADSGFDRLFPNQDYHSGSGFGNLIALPLNGLALQDGTTCFLHPESGTPYSDQWEFIETIQKVSVHSINSILFVADESNKQISESGNRSGAESVPHSGSGLDLASASNIVSDSVPQSDSDSDSEKLIISHGSNISMRKHHLPPEITEFLRDNLNFLNPEYQTRKNLGRSTFKTEKYYSLFSEDEDFIHIPRGFLNKLIDWCRQESVPYTVEYHAKKLKPVQFRLKTRLYPFQVDALLPTDTIHSGVIVAPPGSGKTIMGLELIARKALPALIIVHRKQLFDQWIDRIQSFLGIPIHEIGRFSGTVRKKGKKITVAMIQTLSRYENISDLQGTFGTIIVDECHHIPAKSFRQTIGHFNPDYLYGLTATPVRKYKDEGIIYIYIGDIISEIPPDYLDQKKPATIEIRIRETDLKAPFDYKVDSYETISRILIFDSQRNRQIVDDIRKVTADNLVVLVLTERKEHISVLNLYLKNYCETITLSGDDSKAAKKTKIDQIRSGQFQVVLTTGQLFGEGMDVDRFDCLFLVYPFAFRGKLIQYIGRVTRSEKIPLIYDYRDRNIEYFEILFRKRNKFYESVLKGKQLALDL